MVGLAWVPAPGKAAGLYSKGPRRSIRLAAASRQRNNARKESGPTGMAALNRGKESTTDERNQHSVICSMIQRSMSDSMFVVSSSPQGYCRRLIDMPAACNSRRLSQTLGFGIVLAVAAAGQKHLQPPGARAVAPADAAWSETAPPIDSTPANSAGMRQGQRARPSCRRNRIRPDRSAPGRCSASGGPRPRPPTRGSRPAAMCRGRLRPAKPAAVVSAASVPAAPPRRSCAR